ncbi:MAG: L,D-transpeptidase [Muribaculaceae bacterium]|nr:L,D-transpeptidase [Muribaculaceae bacterium]
MKKILMIMAVAATFGAAVCAQDNSSVATSESEAVADANAKEATVVDASTVRSKSDVSRHYNPGTVDKGSEFILISKKDWRLYVYGKINGEEVLLAKYPCCLSKNEGQKQRSGDMKTPSSYPGKPFTIQQIQDASGWKHNFKDGRGSILAYGHWFLRLKTPGHSGIGIHGSTNNENSVPGRASEGCIRLRDKDIIDLKTRYARVGMQVIILDEKQGSLDFEIKAHAKAVPVKE